MEYSEELLVAEPLLKAPSVEEEEEKVVSDVIGARVSACRLLRLSTCDFLVFVHLGTTGRSETYLIISKLGHCHSLHEERKIISVIEQLLYIIRYTII